MAERPVFIPWTEGHRLVKEISFAFTWNAGFAPVQKKKNITALHAAAAAQGHSPLLEVSTKSGEPLGQHLSAFSLKVATRDYGEIPLECAYQGSKVFEQGGPFMDLYAVDTRAAKKDPRIRDSGRLTEFRFNGLVFQTEPKTAFYDWLYISAIAPYREYLRRLEAYVGFTDIEFNPGKSINCQARSCAMFVAMVRKNVLERALTSQDAFIAEIGPDSAEQPHSRPARPNESNLFEV